MKLSIFFIVLSSNIVFANDLECKAWRQKKGQPHVQVPLKFTGINSVTNQKEYRIEIDDYRYKVDWDVSENTLYASIVFNSKAHVYATMPMPRPQLETFSTLDSTRDDGERVSIDCSIQ